LNKFISNNSRIKFLDKIKENLFKCKRFYFSVSFIKKAGLILLLDDIKAALRRGAIGKLITSAYQNFTDIPSLDEFLELQTHYPNFECHLDYKCFDDNGFHSKGYIFEYEDSFEIIVGSSNITRYALLKNIEWNISVASNEETESYNDALEEFEILWDSTKKLNRNLIDKYKLDLEYAVVSWDMDDIEIKADIKPNHMQGKALKELKRFRDLGVSKSLIIAATASGKTYLAAFDAKRFGASRLLFVVHRDTILVEALKTFKNIFKGERSYGIYNGGNKDLGSDFIFATNIMMSQNLDLFRKDEFDYIVIDECHHATSDTYQKIIEYFKPEFLLGLTATPERMDTKDVFGLFENNVAYELRLRDAIIYNLIVPFKYYGIRNDLIDYNVKDYKKFIREYSSDISGDFIKEEILAHKLKDEKLKCLAFCKNIEHARTMAELMEEKGFSTLALMGSNSTCERLSAFKRLQDETDELEILFAIDILNEGVDIPAVNMILFLRPTESSTIFIQQLGRGLRKYKNKEYVTILDFIGNSYDRSVQIAMALGSLAKNNIIEKKFLVDLVQTDFKALDLPGVEIHIDELSKDEILSYIEKTNFNSLNFLKQDYYNFKKYLQLQKYPDHLNYLKNDNAPDLIRLMKSKISNQKNKSYYTFLKKIDEDSIPIFENDEIYFIDTLSEMLPLVRVDEYIIIKELLNNCNIDNLIEAYLNNNYKYDIKVKDHALKHLKKKNLIKSDNSINLDKIDKEFKAFVLDLIDYGISRFDSEFGEFDTNFKYYANYYKEQIMMVLLEDSFMFLKGTKFDADGTTYIFVGLKKDKTKEELHNYKDKVMSKKIFQWESENNTTFDNPTGIKLKNTKKVHLFIRKMDEENGITLPFTYVGEGVLTNKRKSNNNGKDTLLFDIELDQELPEYLYFDFLIEG